MSILYAYKMKGIYRVTIGYNRFMDLFHPCLLKHGRASMLTQRQNGRIHGTKRNFIFRPGGSLHAPGLGTAFLRLLRILVVGMLLARLGPFARMFAFMTPPTRRLCSRSRTAHLLELNRFTTGLNRDSQGGSRETAVPLTPA